MDKKGVYRRNYNRYAAYGIAAASPFLALLARIPLAPVLGEKVPYMTFFLSTAISASFGGLGPGLVSTFLGALLGGVFVIRPVGHLAMAEAGDYVGLVLFLGVSGYISYLAGDLLDATKQENALRVLFQQTLISIGDAVISTDSEKRVRLLNPVAENLTGWREEEAKGRPVEEVFRIVREGTDEPGDSPIDKVMQTGMVVGLANHTELITRGGVRIAIDDSGAPIRNESGRVTGAVLVFRDIASRRRAELELQEAERRSRNILESIRDAFLLIDHYWRVVKVNSAAETLLGETESSLRGRVYWELFPGPRDTALELEFREALSLGTPIRFEHHLEATDRWFDVSAFPSSEGLAVYFRDVTEKKKSDADLLRLNEDLKQFTFAATHDVREPLRMITVYVQLLQRRLGSSLDEECKSFITQIVSGTTRIARLLDGLLEFSRTGEIVVSQAEPVETERALNAALENLQFAISESGADIQSEALPPVFADETQVSRIFQNLIENGLKYSRPGVAPQIRVFSKRDRGMIVIGVRDEGIGVRQQHQAQIFMPFKRLHGSEISGAGIGLATCRRIVERYGGRIWIESEQGTGSTFYFSLPEVSGAAHAG